MSARARFPGRPSKNNGLKQRVSFQHSNNPLPLEQDATKETHQPKVVSQTANTLKLFSALNEASRIKREREVELGSHVDSPLQIAVETDYSKIVAQTATNLKAFRSLFDATRETEAEKFPGFSPKDISSFKARCKKKMRDIGVEVRALEKILAAESTNGSPDSVSVTATSANTNNHSSISEQTGDSVAFIGFSPQDPLVKSLWSKSFQLSLGAMTNGNGHVEKGVKAQTSPVKSRIDVSKSNSSKSKSRGKPRGSGSTRGAARGRKPNLTIRSSEPKVDVSKRVAAKKIILPEDNTNFRRVKMPRIDRPVHGRALPKLVCDTQGSRLIDVTPVLSVEIVTVKDVHHIPRLVADGVVRSGKFFVENDDTETEDSLLSSEEVEEPVETEDSSLR